MKKVVFFTYGMKFGGVEKVIATLSNYLVATKIECTIITLINEKCEYELSENIKIIPLYFKNGKPKGKEIIRCYLKLRKIIDTIKPDIIISMPEEVSVKALIALYGIKIPIIVSERNNPWVMPKNKLNRILRKVFYPTADGIVFQTEGAKQFFSKQIQKIGEVIPNPIDLSRIPKNFINEKRNEIVTVGRLNNQKNHKLLIESFAKFSNNYPEYKLIIYGEGELELELKKLANEKLLEGSYKFEGSRSDVLECINGSKMFVLSSDYEGMPNALMEAMAMGLPVISTDCPPGGPRALIVSEQNGILVPLNDEEALVNAMKKIANDEKLAFELGENAKLIKRTHRTEDILERWRSYIYEIWNENKKA